MYVLWVIQYTQSVPNCGSANFVQYSTSARAKNNRPKLLTLGPSQIHTPGIVECWRLTLTLTLYHHSWILTIVNIQSSSPQRPEFPTALVVDRGVTQQSSSASRSKREMILYAMEHTKKWYSR